MTGQIPSPIPGFWLQESYERVTGNSTATVMSAIEFHNYFCFLILMRPVASFKVPLLAPLHRPSTASGEHKAPSYGPCVSQGPPRSTKGWLQLGKVFQLEKKNAVVSLLSLFLMKVSFLPYVCHPDHEKNFSESSGVRTTTFSKPVIKRVMSFPLKFW